MHTKLRGALAFAASVGLAAAAGCGGGEDQLTKAEFLKQGNAICQQGNKAFYSAADKAFDGSQHPTKAQITKFAKDSGIPNLQGQVDDIRALTPPSEFEDEVDAFLAAAQSGLDKAKADPAIFASGKDPFKEEVKLAKSYGLDECAS